MIIVTGTPGAGKTTLLGFFKDNYNIINYGTVMFEIAKEKGIVKDRDEMRNIEFKTQLEIQEKAAEKIADMQNKKRIIVDTHAAISTPKGYYPGLSKKALEIINPEIIIFIFVPFEELKERIKGDPTRQREEFLKEKRVNELIEISKMFLATYAAECSSRLAIIDNSGPIGSAVPDMKKILE